MLFNNGFDMEPASGAKPASAVVYQGWKHFYAEVYLKGRGRAELNLNILYLYTDFTHLFHISTETSLDGYRFRKDKQLILIMG